MAIAYQIIVLFNCLIEGSASGAFITIASLVAIGFGMTWHRHYLQIYRTYNCPQHSHGLWMLHWSIVGGVHTCLVWIVGFAADRWFSESDYLAISILVPTTIGFLYALVAYMMLYKQKEANRVHMRAGRPPIPQIDTYL